MSTSENRSEQRGAETSLLMSERASRWKRLGSFLLEGFLFLVTTVSMVTVLFIIFFIAKDALPYFENDFGEFYGAMDDVRIYNRILSEDEIISLYRENGLENETALAVWLPMDEEVQDTSPNKLDVDPVNVEPFQDRTENGMNNALHFNGSSSWIEIEDADVVNFEGQQSFSVCAWVYQEEVESDRTVGLVSHWGPEPSEAQYVLDIHSGYLRFMVGQEEIPEDNELPAGMKTIHVESTGYLNIRTWTFVVGQYDAEKGAVRLYLLSQPIVEKNAGAVSGLSPANAFEDGENFFEKYEDTPVVFHKIDYDLEIGRSRKVFSRFYQFFALTSWYPAQEPPIFGTLAIFFGTFLVTIGSVLFSVPLGVAAAVTLSDILPFKWRQTIKPVIEILAAIPSVAYGFFALVIFAPLLQNQGGQIISIASWIVGVPILALLSLILGDRTSNIFAGENPRKKFHLQILFMVIFGLLSILLLLEVSGTLSELRINSGTNALNVAIILGLMALPTIVSVSEDALQAVGRELREGSYALGATRAETIIKVVLPAASSGLIAAVILGMMRAVGETMVVWMASGNTARIPEPFYNLVEPVRTLTATIAGEMGEAARGTHRYYVLFAMALCLLLISFISNMISEWIVVRARKKMKGS